MLIGVMIVFIHGIISAGGVTHIIEANYNNSRLDLSYVTYHKNKLRQQHFAITMSHQNPSEPVKPHQTPSEPIKTHQNH